MGDVSRDELRVKERAVLFTLLAEGRDLTNAQMLEAGGITLDGEYRRRLNDRKLVTSTKVGRGFQHELTDDGYAWCTAELGAERPERAGSMGGAFYAVLRALGRHGTPLAELFPYRPEADGASEPGPASGSNPERGGFVRDAYRRIAASGEWVGLVRLREEIGESASRSAVDAELVELAISPGVHLEEEPNRKGLREQDREAAVVVGGQERHMIMIEGA